MKKNLFRAAMIMMSLVICMAMTPVIAFAEVTHSEDCEGPAMTGDNYYKKIDSTYHQDINVETCENCGAERTTPGEKYKHEFTTTKTTYTNKTKTKHTVTKSYKCNPCGYTKSSKSTVKHTWKLKSTKYYKKSKKIHKVKKTYACECGKTKVKWSKAKHKYTNTATKYVATSSNSKHKVVKTYKCPCGKSYTKTSYAAHTFVDDGLGNETEVCTKCNLSRYYGYD